MFCLPFILAAFSAQSIHIKGAKNFVCQHHPLAVQIVAVRTVLVQHKVLVLVVAVTTVYFWLL